MKTAVGKPTKYWTWPGTSGKRSWEPGAYADDTWFNYTPPAIQPPVGLTDQDYIQLQGFSINPEDPDDILITNGPNDEANGGCFRTLNHCTTWNRRGACEPVFEGGADYIENPLGCIRNPSNPDQLVIWAGVRGTTQGLYISNDGGDTTTRKTSTLQAAGTLIGAENLHDVYYVEPDKNDFNHQWAAFHTGWFGAGEFGGNSGWAETFDLWETCILHVPESTWGSGHTIHQLDEEDYAYPLLFGTQIDGRWKISEDGITRTKVSLNHIAHGGNQLYRVISGPAAGRIYSGGDKTCYSDDNGDTWEVAFDGVAWSVVGDDTKVYTGPTFADSELVTSDEDDGETYVPITGDTQEFACGPFHGVVSNVTGLYYGAFFLNGFWARKVKEPV